MMTDQIYRNFYTEDRSDNKVYAVEMNSTVAPELSGILCVWASSPEGATRLGKEYSDIGDGDLLLSKVTPKEFNDYDANELEIIKVSSKKLSNSTMKPTDEVVFHD